MILAELAAFLEGGISIHIATRDERLEPNGARVAAVTVDADGTHITAYVPTIAARSIVDDLEANRQVALGFGRPSDDRACQVKGVFVSAGVAADAGSGRRSIGSGRRFSPTWPGSAFLPRPPTAGRPGRRWRSACG